MKSAIGNKLVYGIVVAIVSILVIVVLSIWQYQRIQDTGAIIRQANQLLIRSQGVLNAATQYELNIKNFLLTGDSTFLHEAADTLSVLPRKITSLKTLTADNPIEQERIDSLLVYAARNSEALNQITRLSRSGDFEGAASLIITGATTRYSH